MSQPMPVSRQAWPAEPADTRQAWPQDSQPAMLGFEFDDQPAGAAPLTAPARKARPREARTRDARTRDAGAREAQAAPREARVNGANGANGARSDLRAAGAEWAKLLRSFLPQPVKPSWSRQFLAELRFRGWMIRVAIPILAMVVFGVAVVVLADANSGNSGPVPPVTSLGFPPATLAGNDFTAAASGRGISQSLGRVTSDGAEIVAVGSQAGARIARAQFFVSLNNGRSWTMGPVQAAGGGSPPPGHAAIFVAGGHGAWVAAGPGSIWTSADGRSWTLAPGTGMPLLLGDQISAIKRTAAGFIAVGASVPGGDQAKSTPVVFLSANGINWERLGAGQLRLAAGTGRALDIRYAAAAGNLILIAGDVTVTQAAGKPKRTVTTRAGGAWLSRDGGLTWASAVSPGVAPAGHGAQAQVAGAAAAGDGFVLFRPATVARKPAVDAYRSATGTAWTFAATLNTPAGFTAGMVNGGPGGAVVTGQEGGSGRTLTAFASANGISWQQTRSFGSAGAESVSGVALAQDGAVVTAGTASGGQDSRQPLITLVAGQAGPDRVDIAKIPGAADQQLAVNGLAAQGSTQVAVGGANGFPAAWTSADGGSSWTRAAGGTPAVFGRPGTQQLTGVTYGPGGWLAVGGVTGGPGHPVVVTSANGSSWQAVDGEPAFGGSGLFTVQAAAASEGYVIVGYQDAGPGRTIAAVWWSPGPTGWQRAADGSAGPLDGPGASRQMLAVTASPDGFAAVGLHGARPSAWTSPDGRTWNQSDLPLPAGTTRAVLEHVASNGHSVVAVGTALTTAGRLVPFAAASSNGGVAWTESALPVPAGLASVSALAATGGGFTATGTFGPTPGHQDVVVWTSAKGTAWQSAMPGGQGLTGPGIQAITSLTTSGSTLAGVGFTASPAGEEPVFWQSPIRG